MNRYKVGLQDSQNCSCDGIETVGYYICDCELYDLEKVTQDNRVLMSKDIFLSLKE